MNVFTVHEQPHPPVDRIDRAEQLAFVRDGFSLWAAILPPVWMAFNRLWLALVLYLVAWVGFNFLLAAAGVDKGLIGLINIAAHLIIGFEASSIRRWTLERRSWTEIGSVLGPNRLDCERRFLDAWLTDQPLLRHLPSPATDGSAPASASGGRLLDRLRAARRGDIDAASPPAVVLPAEPSDPPRRSRWRRLFGR